MKPEIATAESSYYLYCLGNKREELELLKFRSLKKLCRHNSRWDLWGGDDTCLLLLPLRGHTGISSGGPEKPYGNTSAEVLLAKAKQEGPFYPLTAFHLLVLIDGFYVLTATMYSGNWVKKKKDRHVPDFMELSLV